MKKFIKSHNLLKLIQELDNLNSPLLKIAYSQRKFQVKWLHWLILPNVYMLQKVLQIIEEGRILPNLEANVTQKIIRIENVFLVSIDAKNLKNKHHSLWAKRGSTKDILGARVISQTQSAQNSQIQERNSDIKFYLLLLSLILFPQTDSKYFVNTI